MERVEKVKNDFKDPLTKGKLAVIDGIIKEVVTYKKLVTEKTVRSVLITLYSRTNSPLVETMT